MQVGLSIRSKQIYERYMHLPQALGSKDVQHAQFPKWQEDNMMDEVEDN